jgi:fatty-acyl-CoA synthase
VPLLEKKAAAGNSRVLCIAQCPRDFKTTLQNTLHYEDLLAEQSDEYEWPVLNEKCLWMCYTSGTTGLPKGVLYSIALLILHAPT